MTQFLPSNLLALFAARDPIPYLPPVEKLSHEKPTHGIIGVGGFLNFFEHPSETPPPLKVETREERLERRRREKAEQVTYKLEQEIAVWNPNENPAATFDPFKTIFVGRINYDTSESKLKREFESYGPVRKIAMVYDKVSGKPRGYAFVEYEHERDMQSAYKHADGKKIDGRRVVVDVERGRTVKGWLPRRLGGGLGRTRKGGPEVCVKISGRDDLEIRDGRVRDDRSRDRSRERHLRSRSRSRRRERERRRSRSKDRDRDRKRRRSRSRDRKSGIRDELEEGERVEKRRRSRSRDRKRDRSDRKKDKKDKDRDRDHKKRDRDRSRREEKDSKDFDLSKVKVKEENMDDYDAYGIPVSDFGGYMKPEKDADIPNNGSNYNDYSQHSY